MNVFSLGASYGLLVYVFQDGHFANLLGFEPSPDGIDPTIPLVMFAVDLRTLDGLRGLPARAASSEEWLRTHDNRASVIHGLARTGRTITSAALILLVVVGAFATGDLVYVKQIGIGIAAAIALDVTLVRSLLVPATMQLLGDWNWWAPRWMRRPPRRAGAVGGATRCATEPRVRRCARRARAARCSASRSARWRSRISTASASRPRRRRSRRTSASPTRRWATSSAPSRSPTRSSRCRAAGSRTASARACTLTRIVLWWSAMTAATGAAARLRVARRAALALRHGRGRRAAEPRARLRALAARARARPRLRAHDHGGRARRRRDAADRRRAARALLVAPGVSDLRRGRSRLRGGLVRVVPRRPAHAPERQRGRARADRQRPAGAAPARAVGRAAAQPQPAGALRDVLRRDLRLVLLPDLAADLPAARARLRSLAPSAGSRRCRCSASRAGSLVGGVLADLLARRFGPRIGLRTPGVVGLPLAALAIVGAVADGRPAHERLLPRRRRRARCARRRAGAGRSASRSAVATPAWSRAR